MKSLILILSLLILAGCLPIAPEAETDSNAPTSNNQSTTMTKTYADVTELKIETTQEGGGDAVAKAGDTVAVHYTGMLTDGTVFDSSVGRGTPIEFPLGAGYVIEGWDKGLEGMKIGEKRLLSIPSDMGYGAAGFPPAIPGGATLIFETELVGIK